MCAYAHTSSHVGELVVAFYACKHIELVYLTVFKVSGTGCLVVVVFAPALDVDVKDLPRELIHAKICPPHRDTEVAAFVCKAGYMHTQCITHTAQTLL